MKVLIEVSLQISSQRRYPGENPDIKPEMTPIAIAGQNVFLSCRQFISYKIKKYLP